MENQNSNSLEELAKFLNILKKHVKLIVVTSIITTIIFALAVIFVVKPKYQSTSEIIVNQKLDKNVQATEQQQIQSADLQLVNTYKSILNSQTVGKSVKESVGSKVYNGSSLNIVTDSSSQVIEISVTSDKASNAAKVANVTADTFKKKVKKIMNVNNVSVISKATVNSRPIFPKKGLSIFAGFIIGIVIGIFFAMFKEFNDKTVKDEEFITDDLGLSDLGTIGDIDMRTIGKQVKK